MKSEKISQNPSFDNFLKNKKWKVIDTANERSVAGLSFAVSTSIWAHAVQKLFPYVIPVGKTTQTTGTFTMLGHHVLVEVEDRVVGAALSFGFDDLERVVEAPRCAELGELVESLSG